MHSFKIMFDFLRGLLERYFKKKIFLKEYLGNHNRSLSDFLRTFKSFGDMKTSTENIHVYLQINPYTLRVSPVKQK